MDEDIFILDLAFVSELHTAENEGETQIGQLSIEQPRDQCLRHGANGVKGKPKEGLAFTTLRLKSSQFRKGVIIKEALQAHQSPPTSPACYNRSIVTPESGNCSSDLERVHGRAVTGLKNFSWSPWKLAGPKSPGPSHLTSCQGQGAPPVTGNKAPASGANQPQSTSFPVPSTKKIASIQLLPGSLIPGPLLLVVLTAKGGSLFLELLLYNNPRPYAHQGAASAFPNNSSPHIHIHPSSSLLLRYFCSLGSLSLWFLCVRPCFFAV